jgi:VTC domain
MSAALQKLQLGLTEKEELLPSVLSLFKSVSLEEMNAAALMDRVDTKYIFSQQKMRLLLSWLTKSYRLLKIGENTSTTYESVYFDTENFELYRQHHCGKLNRYKIRYRHYVENDLRFFEIKQKTGAGRTIKCRIPCQEEPKLIQASAKEFLETKTHLHADDLKPVLSVNYKRITLVNSLSTERITIDTGINFKNRQGSEYAFPLVVAEVKQVKSKSSEFTELMKNNNIHEGFMSKYCFGVSCLEPSLKKNNFNVSIRKITKLQTDAITEIN